MLEENKATTITEKKVDASELAQILQKLPEDVRQRMLYMAQGAILLSAPISTHKAG